MATRDADIAAPFIGGFLVEERVGLSSGREGRQLCRLRFDGLGREVSPRDEPDGRPKSPTVNNASNGVALDEGGQSDRPGVTFGRDEV